VNGSALSILKENNIQRQPYLKTVTPTEGTINGSNSTITMTGGHPAPDKSFRGLPQRITSSLHRPSYRRAETVGDLVASEWSNLFANALDGSSPGINGGSWLGCLNYRFCNWAIALGNCHGIVIAGNDDRVGGVCRHWGGLNGGRSYGHIEDDDDGRRDKESGLADLGRLRNLRSSSEYVLMQWLGWIWLILFKCWGKGRCFFWDVESR
jgi:hypothetical protein